jgi:hypothetical protein
MLVSWGEFERGAPEHAAAGRRLIYATGDVGLGYLATAGPDGRPHVAPICPILFRDGLFACVSRRSPKCRNLERTARYALHAPLGESDEEFVLSGDAVQITAADELRDVHGAIRFQFDPTDPLFRLRIGSCHWAHWENAGKPGTRCIRRSWVPE